MEGSVESNKATTPRWRLAGDEGGLVVTRHGVTVRCVCGDLIPPPTGQEFCCPRCGMEWRIRLQCREWQNDWQEARGG